MGWGYNNYGQTNTPANLTGVTQVACGVYHTYALKSGGTLVGWGDNGYGQINMPANLTGVTQVACGGLHTYSLKSDGTLLGWGSNSFGQTNTPANLTGVAQVACGDRHTYALKGPPIFIASVKPISGPSSGGTAITITGTNFAQGAVVKIDGVLATDVVVVSSTKITAVTPAGFPGEAVVSVDWAIETAFYYRPECGSDLDQNGSVDSGDIAILLLDFGPCQ